MHPDAQRWNERYADERDYYLDRPPYALLRQQADLLPTQGIALDVAAGVSPTGLWLARRGLHVVALDISLQALRLAQARFRQEGRQLSCAVIDLMDAWLPATHFDLILNFYFLSRPLLEQYRSALKPGGLLICEILLASGRQVPDSQNYLLPGELLSVFTDWEIVYRDETWKHGRGKLDQPRRIEQLVARKPMKASET